MRLQAEYRKRHANALMGNTAVQSECGTAKRSTGRRTVERHTLSHRTAHMCPARVRYNSLSSCPSKDVGGKAWETLCHVMCARDILHVHVTVQEFDDTKKYGPYGELFFSLMRLETDPVEAVPYQAREW